MVVQMIRAYFSSVMLRKELLELLRDADKLSSDDPYGTWCLLIKIDKVLDRIVIHKQIKDVRDYDILTRHYSLFNLKQAINDFPNTAKVAIKFTATEVRADDWLGDIDHINFNIYALLRELHASFIKVVIAENINKPANTKQAIGRKARPIIQDICSVIDLANEISIIGAGR